MADSINPTEPSESASTAAAALGVSFRQSRKEMLVMVAAWTVFFIWTGGCGALLSRFEPGEEVPVLFGFPRWAFIGIVLPWLAANVFIIWFATFFMKDTHLGPEDGAHDTSDQSEPA